MPEVEVRGFVEEIRDLGGLKFVQVLTGGGHKQITINKNSIDPKMLKDFDSLTRQSCIRVIGEEKPMPKGNGTEVIPKSLEVFTIAATPLPLEPTGKTPADPDTRFRWRFLDLRDEKKHLIFRVATDFEKMTRDYFAKQDMIEIHTPKLLGAASEGGAEVFSLPYFGREAYLAQSPQFYKQMAICSGMEKVFEIAPVFRADPSFTYRHVTEFISLDVELGYIKSYKDVMKFEEKWLRYVIAKLEKKWGNEVKQKLGVGIEVPKTPFPKIKITQAYDIIEQAGLPVERGGDLSSDGEKEIGKYAKEKLNSDFVFITDYPSTVRPFYHMRPERNQKTTYSYDLLYKGLEITTGAQREHRHDKLKAQAVEKGLQIHNLEFYLDFFKYGAPPHGGFGFGAARIIMLLLGQKNVKEVSFVPRDPKTLFP
ncbi:MAG: aspartate--tRNA(Asn) ligase [Candidatus Micrarchaeota archaeon]|nr:aspartate--tRNA(Asn) ligase [Candidatus Micrarchaeota archaeon]